MKNGETARPSPHFLFQYQKVAYLLITIFLTTWELPLRITIV